DEAGGECQTVYVDATLLVDGDLEDAAAELQVVEIEAEIGEDGRDEGADTIDHGTLAHLLTSLVPGAVAGLCSCASGVSATTAWASSPRRCARTSKARR